jgi:hypothetical protein
VSHGEYDVEFDDDTGISFAVVRAIRRNGDAVEIEFNDGTARGYDA